MVEGKGKITMNKMRKNNWEKKFDELFGDFNAWADMGDPEKEKWSGPKEIKSFIRKLLKGKTKVSIDLCSCKKFYPLPGIVHRKLNVPVCSRCKKPYDRMSNKISSYQKLKKENEELYHLYRRARKRLNELGEGINGDDLIMDFDGGLI